MVGAGVGAGIMAVPYLAARVGLVGLAVILPVAWAASALVHLMLAEVLFRTGRDLQIVELMRLYVLRGRLGQWLLWSGVRAAERRVPREPGRVRLGRRRDRR